MKKIFTLFLVAMLLVGTLAGCQKAPESTTAAPTQDTSDSEPEVQQEENNDEPVTLTMTIWGSDAHQQMYQGLFEEYQKTHPNVNVDLVVIPFAEYQQKLSIMTASDQAPDIAWMSDRLIPTFLEGDQLADVSYLKDDPEYDFADINPGSFGPLTKDGKPYGVAFSNPPMVMFYNKTLFQEKNLPTPTELAAKGEWNFENFIETAKALTDSSKGIYGYNGNDSWKVWMDCTYWMVSGFGGDVFDESGKFIYNSPEAQQGIQMYMDLIFKDEVNPKPGDTVTFDSGKIAMFKSSVSYAGTAKNITDFEWDIAPLPQSPESKYVEAGFAGYVMFKNADPAKEAARKDLFKFLTNKESMLVTSAYFVPSRQSVLSSDEYSEILPIPNKDSIQTVILDQYENFRTYPSHSNWTKIDTEMQAIFDELYTQQIDVETAAKEMEERVVPLSLK